MCVCVRVAVVVVCTRTRVCAFESMCAGWRERGRQRGWSRADWADTEGSRWGWRTMLGSDDTRRTAENCRRTLLFAMRRLNGHTSTARMRTSARSATAAQNGPKCQLGSAASIAAIRAVAGSREDSGSAVGPNRSGSNESLSVMDTECEPPREFWFRAAKLASLVHARARHAIAGGMFLLAATLSSAACAGALVLPLRHPAAALAGARGCCRMAAEVPTDQAKAGLIAALAELRRAPSPSAKRTVLSATSQLEACDDALSASADGRWALLFSTQGAPEVGLPASPNPNPNPNPNPTRTPTPNPNPNQVGQPAGTIPLVQPLIDATYATFFRIAPALAGAQQDGAA